MNQKRKSRVAFFCSLLIALVLEVGTAGADTTFYEWTQNSTFVKSGYQSDQIVYDWQWSLPPFFEGIDDVALIGSLEKAFKEKQLKEELGSLRRRY